MLPNFDEYCCKNACSLKTSSCQTRIVIGLVSAAVEWNVYLLLEKVMKQVHVV